MGTAKERNTTASPIADILKPREGRFRGQRTWKLQFQYLALTLTLSARDAVRRAPTEPRSRYVGADYRLEDFRLHGSLDCVSTEPKSGDSIC